MIARVCAYIRENQMIMPGDKVIVGISGGADSVCLLFILRKLCRELDFELLAVHVNHGLRGDEADRDEAFVKELCEEQGIPLLCRRCDVGERARRERRSLEEAGRLCRYEIFEEIARDEGCSRIAVAHHAEDQAETMLFRLFRGTGIRGLAGMAPVRGRIIRPLLEVERQEIEEWLREQGASWCTDSTNLTEEYARNCIRHTILSCAREQINSGAAAHMVETSRELLEIERFLEEEAREAFWLAARRENEGWILLGSELERLDPVIAGRLIRLSLEEEGGLRDIGRRHIQLLLELAKKPVGSSLSLPGGRRAVREYEGLWIGREKEEFLEEEKKEIRPEVPGICCAGGKKWIFSLEQLGKSEIIPKKTYTKWFDYDKIIQCLIIRTRMQGDYLEINREHGRKKLNRLLIDRKVPLKEREKIWMLADGSHILWIPGMRISEAYKVTEDTTRVLKVQLCGGSEDG